MVTDTALEYNGKSLKLNKMINDLETLGFNLSNLKIQIDDINNKVLNEANSKENSHEFEVISIYTNGINELTKIEAIIDSNYSVYFKIYNYALYILELDITKDNIDEVVNSLKKLIDKFHNTSNIVYDKEKLIVETVYEAIYKVIKSEIIINGHSKIYDYTKMVDVDSYYLHNLVKNELDGINLDKYSDIKRLIYKINSVGFDSNYFEIELIKEIIFKDKKEELSLIAQKSIKNLANQINVIDSICLIKEEEIISSKNREQEIKKRISEARKDIAKKIVALSLASSIPIGSFFGFKKFFTSISEPFCDVTTKTYNSYYDNTQIDKGTINLNKVPSDQNQRVVVKRYLPYVMSDNPYREIETYNLPYKENYDLEDYIADISNGDVLPNKEIEEMNDNSTMYTTDYFEVIYRYVDFESKHISDLDVALTNIVPFIITIFVTIFETLFISTFENNKGFFETKIEDIIYDLKVIKSQKQSKKEQLKLLFNNVKLLLDKIKESKELREFFNNELAKHPELVETVSKELINYQPSEEVLHIVKKLHKK